MEITNINKAGKSTVSGNININYTLQYNAEEAISALNGIIFNGADVGGYLSHDFATGGTSFSFSPRHNFNNEEQVLIFETFLRDIGEAAGDNSSS